MCSRLVGLRGELRFERAVFALAQPAGIARAVGKEPERQEAEKDCRQPFDDEEPLPPRETAEAVEGEKRPGHRTADDGGDRDRSHENRDDAGAGPAREPISEVEDDPRKKSGFRDPEQEAQEIEAGLAGNRRHGGRHRAPADHDARDPDACTETLQREIARHFEKDIADEENADAKAEDLGREAEIVIHGERGKADIDAVEKIDRIGRAKKRNEADSRFTNGAVGRSFH
jgi:hypothetical protein